MKTPRNFAGPPKDKNENVIQDKITDLDSEQNEETNLTEDDLQALGPEDLNIDMGDDELLKNRTHPVDFSGGDLDVPGSELDDENEGIGSEDEENNSYSLGDNDKD